MSSIAKSALSERIRSENPRRPFRWNEFKRLENLNQMQAYAKERLKAIGGGAGRMVFILTPSTVLKVLTHENWFYQNRNEVDLTTGPNALDFIARVRDYHPDYLWIVSELVRPLRTKEMNKIWNSDEVTGVINKAISAGITDIHPDQFGRAPDGRLVIVDYGMIRPKLNPVDMTTGEDDEEQVPLFLGRTDDGDSVLREFVRETLREAKVGPGGKMSRDEALLLSWDIIELLGLIPMDPDDVGLDATWQSGIGVPAGSIRRGKDDVGDIDIVVTSPVERSLISALPGVSNLRGGKARIDFTYTPTDGTGMMRPEMSRSINIMMALDPDAWGAALMTWTGPAAYNMRLRAVLKKRGWKLSQNGVVNPEGRQVATPSERSLQRMFGWTEREPGQR